MKAASMGMIMVVAGLVACSAGEQEEVPATVASASTTAMAATMPDTTAASLWAHLEDVDYASAWAMWPEKSALYEGREPHGMLLTTYVNDVAMAALEGQTGSMAPGAIVVKENYMPDSTLAAVTVMYKVSGYNPDVADWFFLKRAADGTVQASGRVAGCQGCHAQAADNDYLFTGSLSP